MRKTLILGVGNPLMADEGLGIEAVKILMSDFFLGEDIEIVDGGTQGLELLQYFENVENLIIIDAVYSSKKKPGEILIIPKEKISYYLQKKLSVHDIGLKDVLSALDILEKKPKNMTIIGMIPEKIKFSYGLSKTVEKNMKNLINVVLKQLKEWNIGELNNVDECNTHTN